MPIIKYDTQSKEWYLSISEPEEEALAIVGSIRYYFALVLIVFISYQMMFAVITPALITGAFAERVRFKAYVLFQILWLLLV